MVVYVNMVVARHLNTVGFPFISHDLSNRMAGWDFIIDKEKFAGTRRALSKI